MSTALDCDSVAPDGFYAIDTVCTYLSHYLCVDIYPELF